MRTKLKSIFAVLMMVSSMAANGQTSTESSDSGNSVYKRGTSSLERLLPPAPDASSVVKYAGVPVDYNRGMVNLDVPCYTLQGKELSIPISLSYATGGIKMDEIASVAGLGWRLNAGGCITRTVIGIPDEWATPVYSHYMPADSLLSELKDTVRSTQTEYYLNSVVRGYCESSLDRYDYNVCGLSGSFLIGDDGTLVQLSGDGVKITYARDQATGGIRAFKIVGPDGTSYMMTEREIGYHKGSETHTFVTGNRRPDEWEATTAWYVSSITSRSGLETARFSYLADPDLKWVSKHSSKSQTLSYYKEGYEDKTDLSTKMKYIANEYSLKVLKSISLRGDTVSFDYSRQTGSMLHSDSEWSGIANYPLMLRAISVKPAGKDSDILTVDVNTQRHALDGRIILCGLDFRRGEQKIDTWAFSYYTKERRVYRGEQDIFGYFNNRFSSLDIPVWDGDIQEHDSGTNNFIDGGIDNTSGGSAGNSVSRDDVSPFRIRSGYFTIENCNVSDGNAARYMSIENVVHNGTNTRYVYEGSEINGTSIGIRVKDIIFSIGNGICQVRHFDYSDAKATGPSYGMLTDYMTVFGTKRLINNSSNDVTTGEKDDTPQDKQDGQDDEDQGNGGNQENQDNKEKDKSWQDDVGMGNGTHDDWPSFTQDYVAWSATIHDSPVVDGVSVADTRIIYGRVTETVGSGYSQLDEENCPKTVRYYSTARVSPYSNVTISRFPSHWQQEYQKDFHGQNYSVDSFVPMAGVRNGYMVRGSAGASQLLRQEEYAVEGGQHVLKSATNYTYDNFQTAEVLSEYRTTQVMQRASYGALQYQDIYHYPVYVCSNTGNNPTSVTNVSYYPDGRTDSVVVRMSYLPRPGSLEEPSRMYEKSVTEGGKTRRAEYQYADGSTAPYASTLAGQHYLSSPISTSYYIENANADSFLRHRHYGESGAHSSIGGAVMIDSTMLVVQTLPYKKEVTEFSNLAGHNCMLPSAHIEYVRGRQAWREDIISRDSKGNIQQIKEKGKPSTVILWSYDGRYPVAVIENAALSDVTACLTIPHSAEEPFWPTDSVVDLTCLVSPSATQIAAVDNLRTLLPESRVTTFTYDPGIGMTSMTDANGVSTIFEYDFAGRLSAVRDADGNLMKDYEYHLLDDDYDGLLSILGRVYRDENAASCTEDKSWWNTLGLKQQDIAFGASGNGDDLVTAYASDYLLHDDVRTYLPFPVVHNYGRFVNNAGVVADRLYGSTVPYAFKRYEASNRDKVVAIALPGYIDQHENTEVDGAAIQFPKYLWNGNGITGSSSFYAGWEVFKTVSTDADGRVKSIFKDHMGRTLGTSYGNDDPTYYIYDDKDQIRAVAGSGIAMSDTLNMWRYSYDNIGRLSSKAIPGSVRESYEYDDEDRIVAVHRNGVSKETEYDAFGRVTRVYLTDGNHERVLLEEHIYEKDLEVFTRLAIIDADGLIDGYAEISHEYDEKARPVRHDTIYPDGGVLTEEIEYNFPGEVISDVFTFIKDGHTDTYTATSAYDIRGRLINGTSTLASGNNATVSASTQYHLDDFGRPCGSTTVSGSVTLSSTDSYALQGWVNNHDVTVNGNDFFSEGLGYDSGSNPSYTGLVTSKDECFASAIKAQVPETYQYDYAGRLSAARRMNRRSFSGEIFSYDPRGNILKVSDIASAGSAYQQYSYSGDCLTAVSNIDSGVIDESFSFSHDNLGRMTSDGLSGLQMEYNHMDLPRKVLRDSTILVNYSYLADGSKASSLKASGEGLVYRGPFTYRRSASGTLALESVVCDEGRLTPDKALLYVTDHLGSVRAVIDGNTGSALEASDYSAYGSRSDASLSDSMLPVGPGFEIGDLTPIFPGGHLGSGGIIAPSITYRDHFTGQEDQYPDFGIPYSDHGARHYSPALRRWLTPDPLSEKYYGLSPYVYCNNNPTGLIDPNGKTPRIYVQYKGLGHVFITTGEGDNTTVYTYGRYGSVPHYSGGSFTLGSCSPTGEGVLRVLTSTKAEEYLQKVYEEGFYSMHELSSIDDKDIDASFLSIFNGSSQTPTDPNKSTYQSPDSRVIDEYVLIDNNCTTISIEVVNKDEQVLPQCRTPWGLQLYFVIQDVMQRMAELFKQITE